MSDLSRVMFLHESHLNILTLLNSLKAAALLLLLKISENILVDEGKSPAAKSNKNPNEKRRAEIKLLSACDGWAKEEEHRKEYFFDDDIQQTLFMEFNELNIFYVRWFF